MRLVQEVGLEFVNALNAFAAAESECAKLKRMLEEERKLVQRLKQEKDDEAQMAKRKIEKITQRLAEARKDVEYATTRADVAENEWIKAKRELQEQRELVQLLNPACEETSQSAMIKVEEKELELANALNAAATAESECAKLRRMLQEEQKIVQRLNLKKDDDAQLAKRQIEEMSQELADARKDVEYATARADVAESECAKLKRMLEEERKLVQRLILEKDDEAQLAKRRIDEIRQELADARQLAEYTQQDADVAKDEWTKAKKELKEKGELIKLLKLECREMRESSSRESEEKGLELANARNASAVAESECAKLKKMLEEERKLVQRLILEKEDEAQLAKRRIDEINQELADARQFAEYAQQDADVAKDEWTKAKKELKEKGELIKLLKLECQEKRESSSREDEEKGLELANALNASAIAESECAKLKKMLEEERKLVQRLILEKEDEVQLAQRQIEEISQELAEAQQDAEYARQDADIAESEWANAEKELKEKLELVKLLKLECEETRENAKREVEEKEQELADALNAAANAESSSAAAEACVICLTNEKDMAFGCGHMTCEECGSMLSTCPICREQITQWIKLFR